jgi:hypothetical protein
LPVVRVVLVLELLDQLAKNTSDPLEITMGRPQLIHLRSRFGRRNRRLSESADSVGSLATSDFRCKDDRLLRWWGVIAYTTLFVSVLLLMILTLLRHNPSRRETDWKQLLAQAKMERERGNLYYAKALYAQAGTIAALNENWAGLLGAACGMKMLERHIGRHSSTNALLLRAMVAAETRQSRAGMTKVAKAFDVLGENEVAIMALSRIGANWPQEVNDPADLNSLGCWNP